MKGFKSIGIVDEPACEGSEIVIAKRAADPVATFPKAEWFDSAAASAWVAMKAKVAAPVREALEAAQQAIAGVSAKAEACEPRTFAEIVSNQQVYDEMWRTWDRFSESVRSILQSDVADKAALLTTSAQEFQAFIADAAPKWAVGETAMKESTMPKATEKPLTVEELSAQVADLTAKLAAKDAELVTAKAAATPPPSAEEVLKSLDGPARDLVLKAQADAAAATAKADEAQKTANAERELRQAGEYVSKAKAYEPVAGKAADFGPVLQRIESNQGTPEDFKRLGEVLSGAAEIARKSKLFAEVGHSGTDANAGDSAIEKVNRQAVEMVSKGAAKDVGAAISEIFRTDKALYEAYRAETSTRV